MLGQRAFRAWKVFFILFFFPIEDVAYIRYMTVTRLSSQFPKSHMPEMGAFPLHLGVSPTFPAREDKRDFPHEKGIFLPCRVLRSRWRPYLVRPDFGKRCVFPLFEVSTQTGSATCGQKAGRPHFSFFYDFASFWSFFLR